MKFQILSDQHIEFKENYDLFSDFEAKADTLIIAGDFCSHDYFLRDSIIRDKILPKWKNTIMIPGNHEFYGSRYNDDWFGCKKLVYERDGNKCYYVNNDVIEIEGVSFVCTTLWSHIGPNNYLCIQNSLSDYTQTFGLVPSMVNNYHNINSDFLEKSVSSLDKCVIVTHHVPSYSLISEQWKNNVLNEAFAANMDTFIMKHSDKIPVWVYGHSHDIMDRVICNTRFVRNPMGYPHESRGDLNFVVEL